MWLIHLARSLTRLCFDFGCLSCRLHMHSGEQRPITFSLHCISLTRLNSQYPFYSFSSPLLSLSATRMKYIPYSPLLPPYLSLSALHLNILASAFVAALFLPPPFSLLSPSFLLSSLSFLHSLPLPHLSYPTSPVLPTAINGHPIPSLRPAHPFPSCPLLFHFHFHPILSYSIPCLSSTLLIDFRTFIYIRTRRDRIEEGCMRATIDKGICCPSAVTGWIAW